MTRKQIRDLLEQSSPGIIISGSNPGAQFGYSVNVAGDINNDGYADVIIGAPYYSNTGKALVYFGSASGLNGTPISLFSTNVGETDELFGYSVSGAGDINGDGYADVIIGAPNSFSGKGGVCISFGSASGIGVPSCFTLGNLGDQFGYSVSGAGDINKDGYADVIIGVPKGFSGKGGVCISLGSSSGLNPTASCFTSESANLGDQFGYSVYGAGDINGDGYADVIIGAPNSFAGKGGACVYLGSSSGVNIHSCFTLANFGDQFGYSVSGAGDINKDGYADIIIGIPKGFSGKGGVCVSFGSPSGLSPTASCFTPNDANFGDQFGYSVSGAGDINKDGYADVIIGAPGSFSNKGGLCTYFGSSSGISSNYACSFPASTGDQLGYSIGRTGDINNDGYVDIVIGAPQSVTETKAGKVYVEYGVSQESEASPYLDNSYVNLAIITGVVTAIGITASLVCCALRYAKHETSGTCGYLPKLSLLGANSGYHSIDDTGIQLNGDQA